MPRRTGDRQGKARSDRRRAERWTDDKIHAAAMSDPDCPPLSRAELAQMKRVPFAKHVRQKLGLSQRGFARTFGIPLSTLRDWEQGRSRPDGPARMYLRVIDRIPARVKAAVQALEPVA